MLIVGGICIVSGYISLVFPNVSEILGAVGGIASTFKVFIVPMAAMIYLRKPEESLLDTEKIVMISTFTVFISFGVLAFISSVMNLL